MKKILVLLAVLFASVFVSNSQKVNLKDVPLKNIAKQAGGLSAFDKKITAKERSILNDYFSRTKESADTISLSVNKIIKIQNALRKSGKDKDVKSITIEEYKKEKKYRNLAKKQLTKLDILKIESYIKEYEAAGCGDIIGELSLGVVLDSKNNGN